VSESRQRGAAGADAAAELLGLLGLSEDELCRVLDADPLTLLSGELDHRPELGILLDLLRQPAAAAGPGVLARWVRSRGPSGRPIDALLARNFALFEDQLGELVTHGFLLRGGGGLSEGASDG
jgi:hypothetical protein